MDPATESALVRLLRTRQDPEAASLEEFLSNGKVAAWGRLCDLARRSPDAVDDAAVEAAARLRDACPGSFFALLILLAARDRDRRASLVDRFRRWMGSHPGAALAAAGYNLHEYHALLDPGWLDLARDAYRHDPEGAWGILEAASMYEPRLVRAEHVDFFEPRLADLPRDYFVVMLSLAAHRPAEAPLLLERALRAFPEHPAAAVDAAAFAARDDAALQTAELVDTVLNHFDAAPERAWEFFEGVARAKPELFDADLLDELDARASAAPGTLFAILRLLIDAHAGRTPEFLDRTVRLLRRHPKEGIGHARHAFHREAARLLRPDVVRAVCDGFEAAAYPGYEFLRRVGEERPELIGRREVDAAIRGIPHATNYAFGFFCDLLKNRPEFTVESTLALFECLALEPVHRAFLRSEELDAVTAISEAAHVRTGLEKALRQPPRVGSRRARALLAILFRQALRARRHVLLEALRHAGGLVLWRPDGGEKFSPVWDFMMFIVDHAGGSDVSTAAAERFLEGAFQLHYLCRTGAEHEAFLRKLDLQGAPDRPFPEGVRFLDGVPGLGPLHALVHELGRRFDVPPRLTPLTAFERRADAIRAELAVLRRAEGTNVEARARSLAARLACIEDPAYQRAFDDPAAEPGLSPEARRLLKIEQKALARRMEHVLCSEAVRIASTAVERARLEL